MNLMLKGDYGWGLVVVATHLLGSLALTGAGALLARAAVAR
jgi:hypothetical protein